MHLAYLRAKLTNEYHHLRYKIVFKILKELTVLKMAMKSSQWFKIRKKNPKRLKARYLVTQRNIKSILKA